jgi:hypothetical protein
MHTLFPHLVGEGYTETSPATSDYNCIAWAAGATGAYWWPDEDFVGFWPEGVVREVTLEAFRTAFQSLGYAHSDDGALEPGFLKVAFYARDGKPTHAARQLSDGSWTSKLGCEIDVIHTLRGLEGPLYGQVAGFMKRAQPIS